MSTGLLKHALGPVWLRVPQTPFSVPFIPPSQIRLPGATGWIDQGTAERISKRLQEGESIPQIVQEEGQEGQGEALATGAGLGGTAGAIAGRALGGEAAYEPLKEVFNKGITRQGLREAWSKLPKSMKYGPLVGAAVGGLGSYMGWLKKLPQRQHGAAEGARGLLSERILQSAALRNAIKGTVSDASILEKIPAASAMIEPTHVMQQGFVGD